VATGSPARASSPASTPEAPAVRRVDSLDGGTLEQLANILVACVDSGASVGFLPPMARDEALAFWRSVPGPGVHLFAADLDGRIAGTVQLHLVLKPNGAHRAEVAKLLVHPSARRRGVGRALMLHAERVARDLGRTLLVLDTREGDVSNQLYRSLGFVEAGRIPQFCRSETGLLDATVIYYKILV
jgi:GNAT superfamily N-acetyltransferase